ncbi:acyl carrier protein [Ochrobactrum grignonense]|nr:acyl carrier protein [Brucella grignonensis]
MKCEGVGIEDNFFDLGGHSFVAVAMVAAIETAFGVKIPVSSVLYNQTITKLLNSSERVRIASRILHWLPSRRVPATGTSFVSLVVVEMWSIITIWLVIYRTK